MTKNLIRWIRELQRTLMKVIKSIEDKSIRSRKILSSSSYKENNKKIKKLKNKSSIFLPWTQKTRIKEHFKILKNN